MNFDKIIKIDGSAGSRILSVIVAFGGKSDFRGCVKNGKLFEEPATSFCHSASGKIAPRKTLTAQNSTFRGTNI
ncbi:MAG: hypothetical protein C4548_13750 [Desulfobacteraceae bacterium]|nr:MAG: hypothetical protein C4548_13750 [Desulfobacteraceae bacterium]